LFTISSCNNSGDVEEVQKEEIETETKIDLGDYVINEKYKPEQPIQFDEKFHSKYSGIDCKYCHLSYKKHVDTSVIEAYRPEKSIEFPHKIHTGDNGIDCRKCHNSIEEPDTELQIKENVCAECHY